MVAVLVGGGEERCLGRDDIVFQFTHGLEFQTRLVLQLLACLMEGVFRRTLQRIAVLVKEGAKQIQCRQRGEGIDESGAIARDDIEVARACLDEGEEAGSIHAFATGQDFFQIFQAVDDEIEGLDAPISCGIEEVHMLDAVVDNVFDDIFLREVFAGLSNRGNQFVRGHLNFGGCSCVGFLFTTCE